MKKSAACLALISSILFFTATLVQAAEQKIVFNTKKIEYKSGTSSKRCQDMCNKRSGQDATYLLADGWKVVNTSPKEVIAEKYWYVPCNACEPHGCTCIGTEYLLERDNPAPKMEISINELDLLKKENGSLKQEISILKQEIEKLKKQMKSNQKTE